jgi:hypothetical protein
VRVPEPLRLSALDRAYCATMQRFVATGRAPHYTELATALGLSMGEGREVLRALMQSGIPAWPHPGIDYVVSVAPFHNLPTQ